MTEGLAAIMVKLFSDELNSRTKPSHRPDLNRQLIAVILFWPDMEYNTVGQVLTNIREWVNKVPDYE